MRRALNAQRAALLNLFHKLLVCASQASLCYPSRFMLGACLLRSGKLFSSLPAMSRIRSPTWCRHKP